MRAVPIQTPTLNYSREWLNQIDIKRLKKPIQTNKSCAFNPKRTKSADSTPDDLLIAVLFGKPLGLLPLIRTWSVTNSKATCIVLIDELIKERMKDEGVTFESARKNGVHLINVGTFSPPPGVNRGIFMVPAFEFIQKFGRFFDRIVIPDCNDNIFQGDPFQRDYPWDSLGFNFERFTLEEQLMNQLWILDIKAWIPIYNIKSELVNTGMVTGRADSISILSNLMLYVWASPQFQNELHDQGVTNYLIMGAFLRDAGLEYHTRTRGMIGNYRGYYEAHGIFPNYTSLYSDEYSLIIHYYMCDEDSISSIKEICNLGIHYFFKEPWCRMELMNI